MINKENFAKIELALRREGESEVIEEALDALHNLRVEAAALNIAAQRWNALINTARIRVLGYAGLDKQAHPDGREYGDYAHLGLELWTQHPPTLDRYEDSKHNIKLLTEYADKSRVANTERATWPVHCRQCNALAFIPNGNHMCKSVLVKAVKIDKDTPIGERPVGSFWQEDNGDVFAIIPTGMRNAIELPIIANMSKHDIVFHDNGNITVSPSILVKTKDEFGNDYEFHGYLRNSIWSHC